MEQEIREEIRRFVRESPGNRFPDGRAPYFDDPLVGFAAAEDPLFTDYKRIIGDFHLTPAEILQLTFGEGARAATVISWVLPIAAKTRESNRRQDLWPSREWAQTRMHGEALNAALRRHLVSWLEERGWRAVAPQLAPFWQEFADTPVGIASRWSERHAAYAAGLGTFSLNDGLITKLGIAHRLGSVVTDLPLKASSRPFRHHRENCLYFREGTCGVCIQRCPVHALSLGGHDKTRCRDLVYGSAPQLLGEIYGVSQTGCGLCQTAVPCEGAVPPGIRERTKRPQGT